MVYLKVKPLNIIIKLMRGRVSFYLKWRVSFNDLVNNRHKNIMLIFLKYFSSCNWVVKTH